MKNGRSERFPPGWYITPALVLFLLFFALGLFAKPAHAEVWSLLVTPAQTYEDGRPFPASDIVSHYLGCGRDSTQMNEHTFTITTPNLDVQGVGAVTFDFAPGQWYCFSRTTANNGEDSSRSATYIFVSAGDNQPPPVDVRPSPPTVSGHTSP